MPRLVRVKSARERKDNEGNVKPLLTCDKCEYLIGIGAPYKHMSIKTGPYSSRRLVRCAACPDWQPWEYSSATWARIAEIVHNAREEIETAEDHDTVQSALSNAADSIRELAEEKRENARNIEEGFGKPTSQTEEMTGLADDLDSWADEIEAVDIPTDPDPEEAECEDCGGTGTGGEDSDTCAECNGSGHPKESTDDQMETWHDEVGDAIGVLDNSPL